MNIQKKKIATFLSGMFLVLAVFLLGAVANPAAAQARPGNSCNPGRGGLPKELFVPWYYYLEGKTDPQTGKCVPQIPDGGKDYVKGVSLIALAIIDTLIRLSSLIAVGFLIYGSIQYITSQGEPQGLAGAKSTIANALIGLVIVMMAVAIVQFIGSSVR